MGDGTTVASAGLSLASMGFTAAGQESQARAKVTQAQGAATADEFKAEQLDQAATYGDLKATQTAGQMTRNLNMTLSNIDAVRAAGNVDPSSPSAQAVHDYVQGIGNEQRNITVDSITAQAQMDEAGAAYERQAAGQVLLAASQGYQGAQLGVIGTLLGGAAGLFKGSGGGGGGSGGGDSGGGDGGGGGGGD